MMRANKPLGHPAYGSIGHLPNSRLGPGDHCVPEGQAKICIEKLRDRHDRIWVTEKLDGACASVAMIDGKILALGRAGYLAQTSPFEHLQLFAEWVRWNELRFKWLKEGYRIVGEWLALAHGTVYELDDEPIAFFDMFTPENRRVSWERASIVLGDHGFMTPALYSTNTINPSFLRTLHPRGDLKAADGIEGFVYRVERHGKFDFMAKWVRPEKIDGCYLPDVSGKEEVWNWRPK